MLCREVAVVHEAEPDRHLGIFPMPKVVRLINYVVTRWRFSGGPAWSRAGVLTRDARRCAYCGGGATTIDHVLPRSRGGRNTWLNTVAACGGCNQRKSDRTPHEARMPMRITPVVPSWAHSRAEDGRAGPRLARYLATRSPPGPDPQRPARPAARPAPTRSPSGASPCIDPAPPGGRRDVNGRPERDGRW